MKYLKFIIASMILSGLFLSSCSETSNSPTIVTDYSQYLPMTVGSWWITENYKLDENMERVELILRDSTVVTSKEMIAGHMASEMIKFDLESGTPIDTAYFYMDGAKGYEYTTVTPFSGEKTWILMTDFASDKAWTVLDTNVTNVDMGNGATYTGSITSNLKKGESKTIEIKGQNYSTIGFDISMNMNGNISAQGMTFPLTSDVTGNIYYVEGIGQVQTLTKINMETAGQTVNINQESIVVDFSIK